MARAKDPRLAKLKRQRTLKLAKLLSQVYYLKQRGREQEMYDLVCDTFVGLGGVYVKFLQGVLLNSKMMRRWHSPDRLKIFENLETEPLDIVALLRSEIKPEQLKQIALVQQEPFAAGSFGQVYRGQHINGRPIIVKVLRPQIRELLQHDLRLISMFSRRFASREYTNVDVKLDGAIKEFRVATLRETDYITEASFARELFEAYRDHPQLIIPETYMDLCTSHIIVQDYVGGLSAVDLLKLKDEGVDPKQYVAEHLGSDLDEQLTVLGVESMMGVFNLPRIQGDPHPGNIRLLSDNKVAMIDFGIFAPAPRNKSAFFGVLEQWNQLYHDDQNIVGLFEQFMRFFVNDLYQALKKLSSFRPASAIEGMRGDGNLTKEVGRIMQDILHSAIGTKDVRSIVEDGRTLYIFNHMVNRGNRFGLIIRLDASEILRASQTYMTLVESLGRRREVLPRVFETVVARVLEEHPEIRTQSEEPITMTEALETINSWLERVAVRDPALFSQLMERIRKNSSQPKESNAKEQHA